MGVWNSLGVLQEYAKEHGMENAWLSNKKIWRILNKNGDVIGVSAVQISTHTLLKQKMIERRNNPRYGKWISGKVSKDVYLRYYEYRIKEKENDRRSLGT